MSALSAREGYALWAPRYDAETAVSFLENQVVEAIGMPTENVRLLDVGCGTGRRLQTTGAAMTVGVDLSIEMLRLAPCARRLAADIRALPFAAGAFDLVWCRLVIGHVREVDVALEELSRSCRLGGTVIVSDICPEAVAAGHRRTFQDSRGVTREIEHFVHDSESLEGVAADAGLDMISRRQGVVDSEVRRFYAEAGRLSAYRQQHGLPLVRAIALRKRAA